MSVQFTSFLSLCTFLKNQKFKVYISLHQSFTCHMRPHSIYYLSSNIGDCHTPTAVQLLMLVNSTNEKGNDYQTA